VKVDRIISALSVEHLAKLVPSIPIQHIPSVTVGVVNVAFPAGRTLPVQGFGYLIPRSVSTEENPHKALGVVFDSQMFDPDGQVKVTVMMGGTYWQDTTPPGLKALERGAIETLRLHGLLPSDVEPMFVQAHLHKDCIPQYPVGHCSNMQALHGSLLDNFGGKLSVVGSSYSGVGLNDCVKSSWDLTNRIAENQSATGLEGFL
jgi:oxygen-dependent protoporphyrinogen oxidase